MLVRGENDDQNPGGGLPGPWGKEKCTEVAEVARGKEGGK